VRQYLSRFEIVASTPRKDGHGPENDAHRQVAGPEKPGRGSISAKVTERRGELETELSKLAGFGAGGKAVKFAGGGRMGAVAPKYRNPENPAETWAGRGLKPRWLTAAIKGGKKLEDFLIPGAVVRASAAQPTKKIRKMRKPRK
jgi:DNA-binding protein H-NS